MAEYVSEMTRFILEMKNKQPDLERRQREARAIWWDRTLDVDEEQRFSASAVKQQAYVYQTQSPVAPRRG